jgi:hypothetical protein
MSYRFTVINTYYEGVGVLKIEELESEVLCTDSTDLVKTSKSVVCTGVCNVKQCSL